MTRSFFSGKQSVLSGYKARLSGVSLAALTLLGISGPANAQEAGINAVPEGYKAANAIKDFKSVTTLADGAVEIVLATGETVSFAAAEVAMVGGQVFVAETAIAAAGLSLGGAAISTVAIVAAGSGRSPCQKGMMLRFFLRRRWRLRPRTKLPLLRQPQLMIIMTL